MRHFPVCKLREKQNEVKGSAPWSAETPSIVAAVHRHSSACRDTHTRSQEPPHGELNHLETNNWFEAFCFSTLAAPHDSSELGSVEEQPWFPSTLAILALPSAAATLCFTCCSKTAGCCSKGQSCPHPSFLAVPFLSWFFLMFPWI